MLTLLVLQLSLFSCIQALGIFIPLDVDPESGTCSAWSKVIASISANPQTPFYSIINPDDGPGDHDSQPSGAYRQCVQSLRPHANATVLGHVNTEQGKKSLSDILAEINTYAKWDTSYRPTGIFFDGVQSKGNLVSQYETYATYARGKGFTFIALDPGEMPDPSYFGIADFINTYESAYSGFDADADVFTSPSTPVSKQSVWLTGAPKNGSYSAVISQLAKKGVRAVYISDLSEDQSGIPSQWTSFAADVGKSNIIQQAPTNTIPPNVSTAPQPSATGGTTVESSNHPNVGAIVGGLFGALAVVSVLAAIAFMVYRNQRRHNNSLPIIEVRVARPFTKFRSSPSTTIQISPSTKHSSNAQTEPSEVHSELGDSQIGSSYGHGNYVLPSIPTTLQSAPSSSGVLGKAEDRDPSSATSPMLGAETGPTVKRTYHLTNMDAVRRSLSALHRTSKAEAPPTYTP